MNGLAVRLRTVALCTVAGLGLAGCAAQTYQEQRAATGAAVGGATGALIGGLAGGSAGSAVAGGILGAATGGLIGATTPPPPPPVVVAGPRCYWTRGEPVWDDYRGVGRPSRIRFCD